MIIAIIVAGMLLGMGLPTAISNELSGRTDVRPSSGSPDRAGDALASAECSVSQPVAAGCIPLQTAIAVAVNHLTAYDDGYRLHHPCHLVTFNPQGMTFEPRHGGPQWHWALRSIDVGDTLLQRVDCGPLVPVSDHPRRVRYDRGAVVEQYLLRAHCIEQQFVIPRPLPLEYAELMIVGQIECAGEFEPSDDGCLWRTAEGVVSLGGVLVYDAAGSELAARMSVNADEARIIVDGEALAHAVYPVTIDPEIGTNDFRISDMGPDGDMSFNGHRPAAAYNPLDNEYLVVWDGDDDTGSLVEGEFEIFGQRVDAATGQELGANDFRISDMGPDGDALFDAIEPAIAFNSTNREYLVVWAGEDDDGMLVNGEFEIFGQRIDAATGTEIGANDFRISDMGPDGDALFDASLPAAAYNSQENEYLVVWEGDDGTGTLVEGESEIFGQRIDAATGMELGTNDFRISDMGPDGDELLDANQPAIAFSRVRNEYLVVWHGDDDTGALVNNEHEIFGQRIQGATGAELGSNDFRVSDMGPEGDADYDAYSPAVAYNPDGDDYLVVWRGDDNTGSLVQGENEIFGQLIDALSGTQIGPNDFRISDMGPDGDPAYDAIAPSVAYSSADQEYLVVWEGDDLTDVLSDDEFEVFAQRLDAMTGQQVGVNDIRLSDMGPDGDADFDARTPAIAFKAGPSSEYLVTWSGDDNTGGLANEEFEVHCQRVDSATGEETGINDLRLSDMGSVGNHDFDAHAAAAAHNPIEREYLVVWHGDDDLAGLVDGEFEIFGQRIDALTGQEVGPNDFRISDMGPDGDSSFDALHPAVAYSSQNHEYLVVWEGEDNEGALVNGEFEIFGQRIEAISGQEVGLNDFRISDMGPDGSDLFDAGSPTVAFNPLDNEYLVVWAGDDNSYGLVDGESEIFGQRLDAATGLQVGVNDFRISDMGPALDPLYDAFAPALAHNESTNEFLVVWEGEDNTGSLVNGEFEIFGQRIDGSTGQEVGVNDFRISDMGPDGDSSFDARHPALVHNSRTAEYLVVWAGDDNVGPLEDDETEIFGQRLDGSTGQHVGSNDFRISDAGPAGDPLFDARSPAVVYCPSVYAYMVVWEADEDHMELSEGEFEIYGQLLDADTGDEIGENDFRLSDMSTDGDAYADAFQPAAVYDADRRRTLVVWEGDDNTGEMTNDEFEIFGQLFAPNPSTAPDCPPSSQWSQLSVWPNPIRATASVQWHNQARGPVCLRLYSPQGRLALYHPLGSQAPGVQRMRWAELVRLRNLSSGAYFLELQQSQRRSDLIRVVVVR